MHFIELKIELKIKLKTKMSEDISCGHITERQMNYVTLFAFVGLVMSHNEPLCTKVSDSTYICNGDYEHIKSSIESIMSQNIDESVFFITDEDVVSFLNRFDYVMSGNIANIPPKYRHIVEKVLYIMKIYKNDDDFVELRKCIINFINDLIGLIDKDIDKDIDDVVNNIGTMLDIIMGSDELVAIGRLFVNILGTDKPDKKIIDDMIEKMSCLFEKCSGAEKFTAIIKSVQKIIKDIDSNIKKYVNQINIIAQKIAVDYANNSDYKELVHMIRIAYIMLYFGM